MPGTDHKISRPPSVTNGWVAGFGALSGVACMIALTGQGNVAVEIAMVVCALAIAVPIATADILYFKVYKRESTGLGPLRNEPIAVGRIFTKLTGLWGTFGIIAFLYWLLPEYHRSFFGPFYDMLRALMPWVMIFSVPYFILVDQRMRRPHDAYWHLGRILLGHWIVTSETRRKLKEHALGWAIKAFFIPLMTVFYFDNMSWLLRHPPEQAFSSMNAAIFWFISVGFFLDVAFAFVGYALTMRVLDSHIRSSNPLLLGWGAALMCYPPFWVLIKDHYFAYGNTPNWFAWLDGHPTLTLIWGAILIALVLSYTLATVIFGLRFSNLTHRGIITGGPYRFTKHPAYVSKNIYWWFAAVPFIADAGWQTAVQSCLLLFMVNGIYYLRAKTEERHLMSDPTYAAYARWIDHHGLFRNLGRGVPMIGRLTATWTPAATKSPSTAVEKS